MWCGTAFRSNCTARNVTLKTAVIFKYFKRYLSVISLNGYNFLPVIMSVSAEEGAINAILIEDVELVLDEPRRCHQVEKFFEASNALKLCTKFRSFMWSSCKLVNYGVWYIQRLVAQKFGFNFMSLRAITRWFRIRFDHHDTIMNTCWNETINRWYFDNCTYFINSC